MILSGESYRLLVSAMTDALTEESQFHDLAYRLEWTPADVIRSRSTTRQHVLDFIERALQKNCIQKLLDAAREINETNQALMNVTLVLIEPVQTGGQSVPEAERDQVANGLAAGFSDEELQAIVEVADRDRRSAAWEQGRPGRLSIERFVHSAAEEGWFIPLLQEARRRSADEGLRSLLVEVGGPAVAPLPAQEGAWKLELQRRMLSGGFFMINRTKLRSSMKRMLPVVGNRILVVKGDPQSGLSHSKRLMYHLRDVVGGITIAEVDLERASRLSGPGTVLSPRELARAIRDALRYDMPLKPAPDDRQWPAWNTDFAAAFARRAEDDPRRVFLVLDALHKVTLTQATIDLINELAQDIGTRLPAFRLVLVGYRDDLPDGVRQALLLDETGALTCDDLFEFFVGAYQEANVDLDEETLALKVARVLAGEDHFPPGNLVDLSRRVFDELPEWSS